MDNTRPNYNAVSPSNPTHPPEDGSKTFDFPEAIQLLKSGYKITKVEWGDPAYYGVVRDGLLQLHKPDGFHSWIISEGDLAGEDWAVLE